MIKKDYVFISYSSYDNEIARRIKTMLTSLGIDSFLAHEDISVSEEWQKVILKEIEKATIFVCILSANYENSPWCIQESGIAAFRKLAIIPISLDATIPKGFIGNYQATKIDSQNFTKNTLIPGLIKHNKDYLNNVIEMIGESPSFRSAESSFSIIIPYIEELNELQLKKLFHYVRHNNQIHHAHLCATEYIPILIEKYGHLFDEDDIQYVLKVCEQYKK